MAGDACRCSLLPFDIRLCATADADHRPRPGTVCRSRATTIYFRAYSLRNAALKAPIDNTATTAAEVGRYRRSRATAVFFSIYSLFGEYWNIGFSRCRNAHDATPFRRRVLLLVGPMRYALFHFFNIYLNIFSMLLPGAAPMSLTHFRTCRPHGSGARPARHGLRLATRAVYLLMLLPPCL